MPSLPEAFRVSKFLTNSSDRWWMIPLRCNHKLEAMGAGSLLDYWLDQRSRVGCACCIERTTQQRAYRRRYITPFRAEYKQPQQQRFLLDMAYFFVANSFRAFALPIATKATLGLRDTELW